MKIRITIKFLVGVIFSILLAACSSIDSTRPFDEEQAARLIRQDCYVRPARQRIAIRLPSKDKWQRIDLSRGTVGSPVMFIPRCESEACWTESVRTEFLSYETDYNAMPMKLIDQVAQGNLACKNVKPMVLSQSHSAVIYRLQCDKQVQYGKAFNGKDAVYMVYYTADTGAVNTSQISRMQHAIAVAELTRNPNVREH